MKKIIKITIAIIFPTIVLCQKKSITIFEDLGIIPHNKSMAEFPGINNTYILENNPCYGFIFEENGDVWYRDYCPHDYMDISKFGTYTIDKDTISINSTYINTAERIHRVSIKKIEHTTVEKDTFYINTFNENGDEEGLAFSIKYLEYPNRPWKRKKEKWIDLRKPPNWAEFPEEIYVIQIWVSGLKNQEPNSGIWFLINEKWKIKNNRIDVTFFGKLLKIVNVKDEIILLKWDRIEEKYVQFDKLKHKI